jgi:hypothetical protein
MAEEQKAAAAPKAAPQKAEAKRPAGGGTLPGPSGTPEERAGANVGREYSRGQKKGDVERVEAREGAAEGTPRAVSRPKFAAPGADVSNAELDMTKASAVAEHSTYEPNPDPNPAGLRPAPGPSSVQVLGTADTLEDSGEDEPLGNKFEEWRK